METTVKDCESFDCIDFDNKEIALRLQAALTVLRRKSEERKKRASGRTRNGITSNHNPHYSTLPAYQ